jgi:hypothetical protein
MLNFVKKKRGENVVRFLEGNWGKLYNWNGAESKGYKISNFEKKNQWEMLHCRQGRKLCGIVHYPVNNELRWKVLESNQEIN